MKKLFTTVLAFMAAVCVMAQGWPENYGGVMLQGFYWDYYNYEDEMNATGWATWKGLESHASDLEGYIDLIWVPNSGQVKTDQWNIPGHNSDMGYMPMYWLQHNSCFGTQSDLTKMISTYKAKGIGIIEDVVINHKNGMTNWCDFPNEEVTGTYGTYKLDWTLADICYNDNGGACINEGYNVTGAADTGDDFDGCRDLDHTGANVQKNVKTYLDYLQKELGYSGFRYDMVKGYGPQYVGIYNAYAKPTFSVGEFWDNWEGTTWWVNGTKQNGVVQSAAFDFPLKFLINQAFTGSFDGTKLETQGMAGDNFYKRYSVTFVDNHDTSRDGSCMSNTNHVLAANAFILAMPGTPCIFLPHWKTHETALKRMIAARKAVGITNQSRFTTDECNNGSGRQFTIYGRKDNGEDNGKVILLLLGDCGYTPSSGNYNSVWEGSDFRMYVSSNVSQETLNTLPSGSNADLGTARVDMASGTYYQTVTVNVMPSDDFTTLVYTVDGTDPTISSSSITAGGQTFTFDTEGTYTLKVGVRGTSGVRDIQTYRYVVTNEVPTDITIYVRADKGPIYLYAWDENGTLTSEWPGTQLSAKKSADGVNFYYMTFPKTSAEYTLNYILNQGGDDTKTPDQTGIGSTIFTALGNGAAVDLTATYAGLPIKDPVEAGEPITVYVKGDFGPAYLYTWDGANLGEWPGTQMSTTLINGETWFYHTMPEGVTSFNMIVNQGQDMPESNTYYVSSTVYLKYNGGGKDLTTIAGMAEYPREAWYEQGEICAFFVSDNNNDWDGSKNISAYAWKDDPKVEYAGSWPGTNCTYLGFNEYGGKIWKWNYNGGSLPAETKIVFTNKETNGGSNQTADCTFVNGAWYSTSNTGGNTSPISTAVTPSNEIAVANLGISTTATNWNGKSEKVAKNDGNSSMTKDFSLAAGDYIVQAIVRGTNGSTVTLSAKGESALVALKGLDGATSSVQTNGIVEPYATGANNGWQKVELAFTLSSAEKVTVSLSSGASEWQLGALELLPGTTKTKATLAVTETFVDATSGEFSFYERGQNRNALIKATAGTLPALLPYNVIVDGTCANLKLADGNYSFNNSGSAFTATAASYDRTFVPGKRSTICLPFALNAAEASAAGTFWEMDSYNSETEKIRFIEVEEPVANTPYIFEAASAQPFLSISGKNVPTSSLVTVTKGGISFVGVNERTNLKSVSDGTTYYGFKGNEFVKVGTGDGANINPFRAYLMTDSSMGARMSVLFDDEEGGMTGIQDVTPAVEPVRQQPIYNLSGQRVLTPNKKGLYIIGGKKYFVK